MASGYSWRFAVRPAWLFGHVVVLAVAVTMVLLGRWQLTVSNRKGFDLQNFGYTLQWWAFTLFGLAFWFKILRDQARGGRPTERQAARVAALERPVTYRRYVPAISNETKGDSTVAAYNDYLSSLSQDEPR